MKRHPARSAAYRLILDALDIEGVPYIVNLDGTVSASFPSGTVVIRVVAPR